jgi:hypothetical protein
VAITKNIVTDYPGLADPTGATPSGDAFAALKIDMAGEDCDLTIPAGDYDMTGAGLWSTGMTSLDVVGTGATMIGAGLGSLHMSQIGIDEASGKSARIRSVAAGATSVRLTAASASAGHISRAVVGRWMIVAGFDTQGLFQAAYGFPPNAHFVQFVQITGIDGDIIEISEPLRDSYLDTWPEFNRGSAFEADSGGPATVYFLHPDWDNVKTIDGLNVYNGNLIKCEGKDFTFRNGASVTGAATPYPIYPTVNKTWTATDHDTLAVSQMEVDKLVDVATFDGGPAHQFQIQSSSVNQFNLLNTTMDGSVNGTAKNTLIDNCVIAGGLILGPLSNGISESVVCKNTSIALGITEPPVAKGPDDRGYHTFCTMSGGIITVPMCIGAEITRLFVPDPFGRNVLFWESQAGITLGGFRVLAVEGDPWPAVDNQTVTTNVTMSSVTNKKNLGVSTPMFAASDVGKVIIVPGAGGLDGGGNPIRLKTFITAFTDSQNVVVYDDCGRTLSAVSTAVQWGTCNMRVQTDKTGGLPSASLYTLLFVQRSAGRTVYFENVTMPLTPKFAADLCQPAARNRPLYSYSKRTYDGVTETEGVKLYGNIVSITINIITPYTGGGAAFTLRFSAFSNMGTIVNDAGVSYAPIIDLKTGPRTIVITPSGVTGSAGADSALSIGSDPRWVTLGYTAIYSRSIDGEAAGVRPSFTVEFITDQGQRTTPISVYPLSRRRVAG